MMSIILESLFINIVYFTIVRNLSRMDLPISKFLLMIFISSFFTTIMYLIQAPDGFISIQYVCFAVLFLFLQTRRVLLSLWYPALSMIVLFIANIFAAFAFYIVFNNDVYNRENLLHLCFLYCILGTVSYAVSKFVGILFHKEIKGLFTQLNRKYTIYLSIGISIVLLFFYFQYFIAYNLFSDPSVITAVAIIISIAYVIFLLTAVSAFLTGIKRSMEAAHKQELLLHLQEYTANLENMYESMRGFRHDYMNILASLHGYIEIKDLDGLDNYFMKNIAPIEKRIESTNTTLDRLKSIHILEIKGLVAMKLMHAQERGAAVYIEAADEICSTNFDIVSLTRVIGIFIDNALEACLETESKILRFAIFMKNNVDVIIVANSFQNPLPPISEMFKDGFSTKDEKHGLGLFTARRIIDESNAATLDTYVDSDLFIQELRISNG